MPIRSCWRIGLTGLLLLTASHVSANLIQNGGFETGNSTGWTQSGNTGFFSFFVDSGDSHTGVYSAFSGPMGSIGYVSQVINTTVGARYDVSFFLEIFNSPNADYFEVSFGGTQLLSLVNPASSFPYKEFTFKDLEATTAATLLTFGFQSDHGFFALDDVAVTPSLSKVPDTCSGLWMAVPIGCVIMFRRKALGGW